VEGFAGSAIQLQFLSSPLPELPDDTAIVFIHAVNPYGMSWMRRFNENNVDLNRNFLSDEQWNTHAKKIDPCYHSMESFVLPPSEPWSWSANFYFKSLYLIGYYGYNNVKQAVAGGQYHHPNGLFYGGNEIQKGIKMILGFLTEHFSNAEHYCHLDVHTGLGPKGYDTLLLEGDKVDTEWLNALGDHAEIIKDASGTSYTLIGDFPQGIGKIFDSNKKGSDDEDKYSFLNESNVTREQRQSTTKSYHFVTQEFGTLPGILVSKAMREENFYYQQNNQLKDHWSKDQLMAAFWCKDIEWESAILERGNWLIQQVIHFLKNVQ